MATGRFVLPGIQVPGRAHSRNQCVGNTVVIEINCCVSDQGPPGTVGTRLVKLAECSPGLGRLAAKGPQLASDFTPQVAKAVAVQVSEARLRKPGNGVSLDTRRRLEQVNDGPEARLVGVEVKFVLRRWTAERHREQRPTIRTATEPVRTPQTSVAPRG